VAWREEACGKGPALFHKGYGVTGTVAKEYFRRWNLPRE